MAKNNFQKGEIVIYKTPKNEVEVEVRFEKETVWLRQDEIARLYGKERSVITKHINNIFRDKEVDKKSNVQKLHIAGSDKPVAFYSLDVILAVGYRTNSARAIHFRKWATNVLKRYLLKGYAINKKRLLQTRSRLKELQSAIDFLQKKSKYQLLTGQEKEILDLLANYSKTLSLLEQYDKGRIKLVKKSKAEFVLEYEEAKRIIKEIKKDLISKKEASDLFGQDNEGRLAGIIKNIYQTFKGKELYPSLEEKAAHLLYFIVKDHPFIDGNKRIASFLFVYFLDKNNFLYKENRERKINDNALTALTLLIAVSEPKDKDILIKIITNLIS
ncbi:phosphoribosylaminoimidazole-succinocarboxamide synthase [Candidatus Desulfofervidus auxilii]|uniref:Phosphoribosylaminoimidazole-succinocarboxamide synthase n=1 Tax=Desulfofervidus auxilii TaxID=1621989 RepID=A0A7U4QLC9_DESA2|nr:virulence protein RhuM/Fic/DOC family protein [Candidatus Desulfofervidus auxilii]AMM41464.1 phosphoribosylaminoimidazole-succinocarboxamide synthase [Candidatus Desulfofervidus auxilii]